METKTDETTLTDLLCDSCHSPMYMKKVTNITTFDCSHCDQKHFFSPDGHHTYILATIFPSMPIQKYPDKLKRKYITHWELTRHLDNYGRFLAGLRSELEYNETKTKISEAVCSFWRDEDEQKAKKWGRKFIKYLKRD